MRYYCLACTWTAATSESMKNESGQAAIDHHVATGHSIVSESYSDTSTSDYRVQQVYKVSLRQSYLVSGHRLTDWGREFGKKYLTEGEG